MSELQVNGPPDLARVVASAPSGSRVVLAPGRYLLREPLALPPDITLVGAPGKTLLVGIADSGRPLMTVAQGAQRLAFHDLTFEAGDSDWGGVLAVLGAKELVVEGCRFIGNSAERNGGALFLRDVAAGRITRCSFVLNRSKEMGGALDVGGGCNVVVDRSMFFENKSKVGGAAALNAGGALQLRHCTFVDNEASWPKGGGALFVLAANSQPASGYVANSVFRGKEPIWGDPSKEFKVYVTHSVVPADLFEQRAFTKLEGNSLGAPTLEVAGPELLRIAAGSLGAGTANLKFSEVSGVDLAGRPLVHDGVADPGAVASVPRVS